MTSPIPDDALPGLVEAVAEALGCEREAWPSPTSPGWCSVHWEEDGSLQGRSVPWTDRGCPVAVKVVAAVLDHLGLVEERQPSWDGGYRHQEHRFVTPWREVEP